MIPEWLSFRSPPISTPATTNAQYLDVELFLLMLPECESDVDVLLFSLPMRTLQLTFLLFFLPVAH